jgi:hypothetical protein
MTLVPLTDCCFQLGVDPKTLRGWLKAAHLSPCLHPADARVKCLTHDQLNKLAALHDRRLLLSSEPSPTPSPSPPVASLLVADLPGGIPCEIVELRRQLTLLQTQVATLQAQVTELALALLRSPGPLQVSAPVPVSRTPAASSAPPRAKPAPCPSRPSQPRSSSAPKRPGAHSHVLPLIEVRSDGTPVVISPTEGVLPLVPDSPDWFAWLASLKSFSFRCSHGQFNANRRFERGKPAQSWNLRRTLHGRLGALYLGLTHTLTLARLQEKAATLHARQTNL